MRNIDLYLSDIERKNVAQVEKHISDILNRFDGCGLLYIEEKIENAIYFMFFAWYDVDVTIDDSNDYRISIKKANNNIEFEFNTYGRYV